MGGLAVWLLSGYYHIKLVYKLRQDFFIAGFTISGLVTYVTYALHPQVCRLISRCIFTGLAFRGSALSCEPHTKWLEPRNFPLKNWTDTQPLAQPIFWTLLQFNYPKHSTCTSGTIRKLQNSVRQLLPRGWCSPFAVCHTKCDLHIVPKKLGGLSRFLLIRRRWTDWPLLKRTWRLNVTHGRRQWHNGSGSV